MNSNADSEFVLRVGIFRITKCVPGGSACYLENVVRIDAYDYTATITFTAAVVVEE